MRSAAIAARWPIEALALWQVGCGLCAPTSEHWMARRLETTYVCDRSGRRWWPAWRDDAERLASHRPRVRVKDQQLRQWYGTLDRLVRHKPTVEQELFRRLRICLPSTSIWSSTI